MNVLAATRAYVDRIVSDPNNPGMKVLLLDAETTKQRIAERGRAEEGGIDEGFLRALTERHEAMFGALSHRKHRVDAAGSPAEVAAAVLAVAESMLPGHAGVGSGVGTPTRRSPMGIAIDVGAGSPLVIEDLDSPIATAAEPTFAPGLPLAAVASAWDEAADAWDAQRVACPGAVTYERQCAVCRRTLASRLRCYGSRSTDAVFESADQLCYHQRDGPPLGFCGARCHRLFQPWMDVIEDCVSDMGVDYAGLEWAAEEAEDDCRRKLRAVRLFVGVGRAIGKLLLLRRRVAEARGEVCGDEGGEGEAVDRPWAPKDTDELLHAMTTQDYGVPDDRSSKLATPASKAYNKVADTYHQVLQRRGQPLHEGFVIVNAPAGLARSLAATMHFVDALTRDGSGAAPSGPR